MTNTAKQPIRGFQSSLPLVILAAILFAGLAAAQEPPPRDLNLSAFKEVVESAKFFKEQAEAHQRFIESMYTKIVWGIGLLGTVFGGLLMFLNMRTAQGVREDAQRRLTELVDVQYTRLQQTQIEPMLDEFRQTIEADLKEFRDALQRLKEEATITAAESVRQKHGVTHLPGERIAAVETGAAAGTEGTLAGKVILWVDDRPGSNASEREQLEADGAIIEIVTTTEDGLAYLQSAHPDMVITDMSRLEGRRAGLTLLREMEGQNHEVAAIVYCGAKNAERLRDQVRRLGGLDAVSTPRALFDLIYRTLA